MAQGGDGRSSPQWLRGWLVEPPEREATYPTTMMTRPLARDTGTNACGVERTLARV